VKLPRIILLLQILTTAVLTAIFVWQMTTLPGLQLQLRTGMHSTLTDISREAAVSLDRHFAKVAQGGGSRVQALPLEFTESNLSQMQLVFSRIKATEPLANAWVVAFCDTNRSDISSYEYIPPGRYRPESDFAGSWRKNTDLSSFVKSELDSLVFKQGSMTMFTQTFRQYTLDSALVLNYGGELSPSLMIGTPVFSGDKKQLRGFVFSLIDDWYLENRLIPDFFNDQFNPESAATQGVDKKYLRYGVFSRNGNQLIYNSVAFGRRDFEHVYAMEDVGSWLSGMKVGVSFRNSRADEVADSIYDRNFYLIVTLFVALIIFLAILFWAARRLVKLSQLKTEFVANVSHEIKTPLASIRLASDTLRLGRANTPEQQAGIVKILTRESERLEFLVRTLLDFSQLEAGQKKYKTETVEVNAWWKSTQEFIREKTGTCLRELSGSTAEGSIRIDKLAVEQVINILLDNAIKYGGENPQIDCRIRKTSEEITLEVQDYGIGISRLDQKLVFEKFVRLGNVDIHNVKGHGIGLSIARAIMKDLGGRISLESTPGEGSTFRLHFPLAEEIS
jgi:signal transduction histidine kinase